MRGPSGSIKFDRAIGADNTAPNTVSMLVLLQSVTGDLAIYCCVCEYSEIRTQATHAHVYTCTVKVSFHVVICNLVNSIHILFGCIYLCMIQ